MSRFALVLLASSLTGCLMPKSGPAAGAAVPTGEPLALVAATRRLLDNPTFASELARAGRQAALARHAAIDIAARWPEVYGTMRKHS